MQTNPLPPTSSGTKLLSEWLDDPEMLRLPSITLPYVVVEGRVTLLSGREKIGKSTFAGNIVASASRGDKVLGVPLLRPVCALWYALDEPLRDAVRRFKDLGADGERIGINDQPRTIDELEAALRIDFETMSEVDVVVLDNLSRVLAMSGIDPNDQRQVEPVIARLVDSFHKANVAAILLYHTGKGGKEYRGSTAIGATVDDVLTLRKRVQGDEDDFEDAPADDGRRLLVQDGRTLRGRVHLTCSEGVYRLYQDANPPRTRIINALRDHGTAPSRSKLAELAGVRKEVGLEAVRQLLDEGVIIESGKSLKLRSVPVSTSQFPPVGTTPEPTAEPKTPVTELFGSRSGRVGVPEAGTDAKTRRVIQRDGRDVTQVLRPTQHGDHWYDVGVA